MSHNGQHSPVAPSRRRRSSGYSITASNKPSHSRPSSALDRSGDYGFGIDAAVPEGLDNLAAELGQDGWDEDEEEELDEIELKQTDSTTPVSPVSATVSAGTELADKTNGLNPKLNMQTSPGNGHCGSEEEDIDESKIISKDLETQISTVEMQSKQEIKATQKSSDVFERVGNQLRNLSSQSKVEDQAARLTNTMRFLDAHLTKETRQLQILIQPFFSPFAPPPDPDTVEALLPLIQELILSIPAPPSTPLPAIHVLNNAGADILSSLAVLSDNLYITQQNTSLAKQRLRSTRDLVNTVQEEMRLAEEGRQYLIIGGWDDKLRRQEAKTICHEIVSGFEETCNIWRQQLFGPEIPA